MPKREISQERKGGLKKIEIFNGLYLIFYQSKPQQNIYQWIHLKQSFRKIEFVANKLNFQKTK